MELFQGCICPKHFPKGLRIPVPYKMITQENLYAAQRHISLIRLPCKFTDFHVQLLIPNTDKLLQGPALSNPTTHWIWIKKSNIIQNKLNTSRGFPN